MHPEAADHLVATAALDTPARVVSGDLAKGARNEFTVGCLCDECGNIRGRQLVGEPLPSFSEPDRVTESRSPTSTPIASNTTERRRASAAASELTARRIEISTRGFFHGSCPGLPGGHCTMWCRG